MTALRFLVVIGSIVLLVAPGCEPGGASKVPAAGGDSGLSSRLAAARSIGNTTDRDDALAKVALAAAEAGEADIVKGALGAIGSTSVRDTAAAGAARRLAKVGKGVDAVEVAKSIAINSIRDETLKSIASNE